MANTYATVDDVIALKRKLTADETTRCEAILPMISAELRVIAKRYQKDLDKMVSDSEDYAEVVKSVVVDIAMRELLVSTNHEPMTQYSESANGYSASGTYLVAGGGLFIKNTELKRLGLTNMRYGTIEMYDVENPNEFIL